MWTCWAQTAGQLPHQKVFEERKDTHTLMSVVQFFEINKGK